MDLQCFFLILDSSEERDSQKVILPILVIPTINLPDNFEKTLVMPVGSSAVIEVPFSASPKPTIAWTWKAPTEGAVETTQMRFTPETAIAGLTNLPLKKVRREEAGQYKVIITNELGETSVTVHVVVLDKPSPPRNPRVTDNTGESVQLHWEEPLFTGLEPGATKPLEYVVEMREVTQRANKPVTTVTDLSTPVQGLTVDRKYIFAIAAKNTVGQSDFVETQPVSTKLSFGVCSNYLEWLLCAFSWEFEAKFSCPGRLVDWRQGILSL